MSHINYDVIGKEFDLPTLFLEKLYELMKTMTKYFKDNHIKYFADGGTLLGIIREQRQITYDNDIDFGMFENDFLKVLGMLKEIETKFNYFTKYENYQIQIFHKDVCLEQDDGKQVFPCLDIFLYKRFNNRILPFIHFPNCYYKQNEFLPLVKRKYYNPRDTEYVNVITVNNPIPYLERYYGEWKKRVCYDKHY